MDFLRKAFAKIWEIGSIPFHKFENKHPKFYRKHRDLIGSMVCGFIGAAATYILVSFLPYIFGQKMAEIEVLIPDVDMQYQEIIYSWSIIGFPARIRDGEAIIGGGLGYSISYYFANVVSHAITYSFMRKFHNSNQNVHRQYLFGLALCFFTCILTNMINGLWLPIVNARLTFLQYNIIVLGIIGFVNFVIGHISNLFLYKDRDKKIKKSVKEHIEKLDNEAKSQNEN